MKIKKIVFVAKLFVATAVVGICGPLAAQSPNVAPSPEYGQIAQRLSVLIRHEMADKKLPAFSIVLVDGQKTVWAQGFGYADPEKKIPATAETVYRIGSVSKLFTDIALMQLVERGNFNLDTPVQKYLPDFHPNNPFGTPITIRQLMSHRSGLLREPPVGNYFDSTDPTLAATVHSLNDTTLVYAPETHSKYSNAGLATVGYVLEKYSGQSFAAYLQHSVLAPVGLRDSAFQPEPRLTQRLAKAYMWSYDGLDFQAPRFEIGESPAGCMYSTVLDLGKFMAVLFNGGRGPNGDMLKAQTLETMWTPQFTKPGETSNYGIGFSILDMDGHRKVGHSGAIYGFATQLAALPDDKLGVATVTTRDGANAVTAHVAQEALRLMLAAKQGKPLPAIPVTKLIPASRIRQLAGRYGQGQSAVDLIAEGNDLYILPVAGGEKVRLRQIGASLIEDGRVGYGPKVVPVENGIRFNDQVLHRIAVPAPAAVPARWKGLIGEYGPDYNKLFILEKDGKLTALIEWFTYEPMTEVSKDVFDLPDTGLYEGEKAIFTRDAQGNATQVKISGVIFKRRPLGAIQNGIFRVQPLKPISVLTQEALAAQPPHESGNFRKSDMVDIAALDPTIHLDIRYATKNNFLGAPVYSEAKAFMQRAAAEALVRVNQKLKPLGYGLLIHDAYRPWYVTKIFWDATPQDKKIFVSDPKDASRHNRGCAVDLSMYDLKTGKPVQMPGVYDEMSQRSYAFYPGGTSLERWHRDLLRRTMESEGFNVYEFEWWHFDYKDWSHYPIMNSTFEELSRTPAAKSAS